MTEDQALDAIRRTLHEVAPEVDIGQVDRDETFREALDLDSIDFLNFVVGLHERTGIEIPERDYSRIGSLAGCVTYLTSAG